MLAHEFIKELLVAGTSLRRPMSVAGSRSSDLDGPGILKWSHNIRQNFRLSTYYYADTADSDWELPGGTGSLLRLRMDVVGVSG